MESNLKRVIGDLNKSRGLGENGTASGSNSGSAGSAEAANPIAKVCFVRLLCLFTKDFASVGMCQIWLILERSPSCAVCCSLSAFEPSIASILYPH